MLDQNEHSKWGSAAVRSSMACAASDCACNLSASDSRSVKQHPTRLDARISIIVTFAYSVSLFFVDTWWGMAVFVVLLLIALAAMRVGVMRVFKTAIPLFLILAFTVLAHIPQGLGEGFFYALRILLLALATLIVAFSYDDAQFVRAFSSFGRPLRVLHVPVDDIATMFSIALRFIPSSVDEFKRVANAQRSRGAQLDDGAVMARIRLWGNVLVPMLVGMFHRASVLAEAMEARCYSASALRTSLYGDERLGAKDIALILALCAVFAALGIVL